jgi:predicted Rossmann-fold nucleotide-binding protein
MLEQYGTVSAKDLDLIPIVDSPKEVIDIIHKFYAKERHKIEPNLSLK